MRSEALGGQGGSLFMFFVLTSLVQESMHHVNSSWTNVGHSSELHTKSGVPGEADGPNVLVLYVIHTYVDKAA